MARTHGQVIVRHTVSHVVPCSVHLQGGRASNPILREDQMLKKVRRRNKQAEAAAHDPFAPEFGNDTWHIGGKTQAGMDPSKVGRGMG